MRKALAVAVLFASGVGFAWAAAPPPPKCQPPRCIPVIGKTTEPQVTQGKQDAKTSPKPATTSSSGGMVTVTTTLAGATTTVAIPRVLARKSLVGISRFRESQVSHRTLFGIETWRTRVILLHRDRIIGTGVISCVRVERHTTVRQCFGTYLLPRGRVQVSGEIIQRQSFELTVTGGSGAYVGVRGVGLFSGLTRHRGLVTFFFT